MHVAYIENVPEGADAEQIFRALSRKGFNLILGTSFGYMDGMEVVAEEFPDIYYVHLTGYKSNLKNFGNLMGCLLTTGLIPRVRISVLMCRSICSSL